MGKYGRPKLNPEQRRAITLPPVRVNIEEKMVIEDKAHEAGLSITAWMRIAAQERTPPARRVNPALNAEAWKELRELSHCLSTFAWRFQPGDEDSLRSLLEIVRDELRAVRNQLNRGSVE
jgi:hypothetical protein